MKNAQEDAARLLKNAQEDAARLLKNAQEDAARLLKNAQEDAARDEDFAGVADHVASFTGDTNGGKTIKKDKMYAIGEMASRLAHDLQNPLTIIKNTVEILKLKQPELDKKTQENYERIERATSRMSQLIREILDYVRTSSPLREKTSLVSLLKTVIGDLSVPEDIKVILPDEDIEIYGDVKQLEIVFSNLIVNSIQAIDKKGKIMIQASETDESVVIDVIDNGRGIEKENLGRIFEPLFTTKQGGTGLGLASCKSIIENHGGTIECSSIAGKGTVFTIHLPKF
ncbi:MAG TPA: ATP-binding protein [Candidatus Nitrosotenuis sp.]|nr:ATP-binding protein [Candidatus Nitrosotenuis sp.]